MLDQVIAAENWIGVFVGVLVAMYYFLQKGLQCCSLLHLKDDQKLTGNEPFYIIASSYLINVLVAFFSVMVLYGAVDVKQFAFASISLVSLLSGHMSFKEFRQLHGNGE